MRPCRKCGVERSEDQFPPYGGKAGHVCVHCKKLGKVKPAKVAAPKAAKPSELTLAFPAGFGFDANTRGDVFQIDQWPSDGNGEAVSIVLSRAELATIMAHFSAWAEHRASG